MMTYTLKEPRGFFYMGSQSAVEANILQTGLERSDFIELSDEDYNSLINHPDGQYMIFDEKGPRLEKLPDPEIALNLETAQAEYNRASDQITALQQRIDDEDYDETNTEESVSASKKSWTTYRKTLRAYLAAADGTKALPAAPDI